MNTTMITNHMFWPPSIKLTSLLVRFCRQARAAGRDRRSMVVNRHPSPSANRASRLGHS
jgi:hypothetical protein